MGQRMDTAMGSPNKHFVLGTPLSADFDQLGLSALIVGMGCFWGAEKSFWKLDGVHSTSVGYSGGTVADPNYQQVCTGRTGHAEVVRIIYDAKKIPTEKLLKAFWEGHDPTQVNKQGNDHGTQYRSCIFWTTEAQRVAAEESRTAYEAVLKAAGHGHIATQIERAGEYYLAEDYHQQYLAKNPGGYCGHGGTGVSCPIGLPH